jgi:hypothetical protein
MAVHLAVGEEDGFWALLTDLHRLIDALAILIAGEAADCV